MPFLNIEYSAESGRPLDPMTMVAGLKHNGGQ